MTGINRGACLARYLAGIRSEVHGIQQFSLQDEAALIDTHARLFREADAGFAHWAEGYGPIRHAPRTQVRVHEMAQLLVTGRRPPMAGLGFLGLELDERTNAAPAFDPAGTAPIQAPGGQVAVLVVRAREEWLVARQARDFLARVEAPEGALDLPQVRGAVDGAP